MPTAIRLENYIGNLKIENISFAFSIGVVDLESSNSIPLSRLETTNISIQQLDNVSGKGYPSCQLGTFHSSRLQNPLSTKQSNNTLRFAVHLSEVLESLKCLGPDRKKEVSKGQKLKSIFEEKPSTSTCVEGA